MLLSSVSFASAASLPSGGQPAVQSVAALPPVSPSDPRFGIVQAFEASGVALNAGSRWERVPFFWNKAQPTDTTEWFPDQFLMNQTDEAQTVNVRFNPRKKAVSNPHRGRVRY